MSDEKYVVRGEASESDTDDESITKTPISIVDGEASESDEELANFDLKTRSLGSTPTHRCGDNSFPSHSPDDLSLLQTKLVESNLSLYTNLNQFIQTTFRGAAKDLRSTDLAQHSSQMHLQSAARAIRQLSDVSGQLAAKTNQVLTSNFLANVKLV